MRTREMVLGLVFGLQQLAAAAPPAHCPANEKPFHCHRLALNAHLGLDGPVDLASAKSLYIEACGKGSTASCNNLAVLALAHPELGKDVAARAMFDKACNHLGGPACANARRLDSAAAFAVELDLVDTALTVGAKRWSELVQAACRAGDVFRCEDAASRERVAALLAKECRAGVHETCFDAGSRAGDAAAFATLMGIACTAHEGRACYALAARTGANDLWQAACVDKDFEANEEEATARTEACARWGKAAKQAPVQLRIATITAGYCSAGKTGACAVAEELYDRAGAHAKAFDIAKAQCDVSADSPACRDVVQRYVAGDGTPVAVAKAIEMLGGGCVPDLPWATCKKIGRYLEDHGQRDDAAKSYEMYCTADNDEACYLGTRAFEADGHDGTCRTGVTIYELKRRYDALCKHNFRDSCRRSAGLCPRAMADFTKPDECTVGIGDGVNRFSLHYHAVVDLCPKASWTPAVRAEMTKIDEECKQFAQTGGRCER